MGKTGDLFKKIGDIKKTFHTVMGMIKDRNFKDLTEAEEMARIQRRTVYSQRIKKGLNDQDNHDGAVTHLHPDILESEVKSGPYEALLPTKPVEVMEFQLSYLKT